MSVAAVVLERIEQLGVRMMARDDRLILEPGSRVPPDLLAQVREHKTELLSIVGGTGIGDRQHFQNVTALRARLATLRHRIDKGFDTLQAMAEAGKIEGKYPLWLETWEKLLKEYEDTADRLAEITRCPIGDCSRFESCATKPAPCPVVREETQV